MTVNCKTQHTWLYLYTALADKTSSLSHR